jgi:pimeloyl-ACP methyl ester carboxylesterase
MLHRSSRRTSLRFLWVLLGFAAISLVFFDLQSVGVWALSRARWGGTLDIGRERVSRKSDLSQENVPRFEPAPCPVPVPPGVRVECGYLIVLENRVDPDSRTIKLAVAILKSRSSTPAPDPIIYLQGGPGASALKTLDYWVGSPFLDTRDFILLEQRGTRYSEPWLDCPEVERAQIENFSVVLSNEEEIARTVKAAESCRDRLVNEGVNLAMYNSRTSAADFEDLRTVLGYGTWNLYGVSYGTRLALTVVRDYPDGVRSVILDSATPPPADHYLELVPRAEEAFQVIFEGCATDPDCRAAYPDLEKAFYDVVGQMNANPVPISARFLSHDLLLTGDDFVVGMYRGAQNRQVVAFSPLMIEQLHRGNRGVLLPLAEQGIPSLLTISKGMYYSVQCYGHAEASSYTPQTIAETIASGPMPSLFVPYHSDLAVCPLWGAGEGGDVEDEPVYSDIPTLVMAGEYDPITPPRWGRLAAETLSNGFFYEFPGLSHGASFYACPRQMALSFIDDPTVSPDASCMAEMERLDYVVDKDLYVTSAIYRLNFDLLARRDPFHLGVLGFCLFAFLTEVFLFPGNLLRLIKDQGVRSMWLAWLARGLALVTSVLNLTFLIGLVWAVRETIATNWFILAFGVPAKASWLFVIPYVTVALAVGLFGFAVLAWKRAYWSIAGRVHHSLVLLATWAFVWFLCYWDLLT